MVRVCKSRVESGVCPEIDWKGSELEGLGFNLYVVSPRVVMSLILEIRDQRVRVDLVVKTEVSQGQQRGSKL